MTNKWQPMDREQALFLPPSIDDLLPDGHLARFVVEVVESLDLSEILSKYERRGRGSTPYHPSMMLALLFYGYATGTMSSRKIERACRFDLAFRFIACGHAPDHDTIASFRRRHHREIARLFVRILILAREMGILKVGTVAVDGTKIKASASKHAAVSYARARQIEDALRAEVRRLMRMAEEADNTPVAEGIDIPAEIARREDRIERLRQAQLAIIERHGEKIEAELEEKGREYLEKTKDAVSKGKRPPDPPEPPAITPPATMQENFTDPDSRIMPDRGSFSQAYNAQASVDCKTMLIVGQHITQRPNDKRELLPALAAIDDCVGVPELVLADSGYFSASNMFNTPVPALIAPGRTRHNKTLEERLVPPSLADDEPLNATPSQRMRHRLDTAQGRESYRLRKMTVEPVFGIIKSAMGVRQFLMRGVEKVRGEWALVCVAYNLRRLWKLQSA